MAAVLDALAPYVKKLIADMAQEEVSMLLGVSTEITKLEDNMEGIKAFLADAERRRITDKSVQRWSTKLKSAMYDATDILDLCQLEADKQREARGGGTVEHKSPSCFQPLLFCLRNPVFAHKIGSRIKELNQRLEGIHKEADKYRFNIGLGSNPESRMLTSTERYSQKMTSEFNESSIVGQKIEMDTKELGQLLVTNDNHNDIKVVSIVGTGGMGKTTLAQKIFHETTVQQHFKLKIWLSITQLFNEVELLRTAIEHAGGVHGGAQDKTLLVRTLTDTLSMGRFLLVLDDVWSDEAWSNVLSVPVKNASQKQQGNWILITTRLGDMAQRMGASFYQHHVSPLNEEDAWSLLNKQLPPSPSQVDGNEHLKDVGMKIIQKCGGLPLAIKVMGGLLSTRSRTEGEWLAVLNHRAWSVAGLPKELDNRIYLSYEDLSPQLKQCFLYCSLFQKEMARISSKEQLDYLELCWSSSRCMGVRDEIEKQRLQDAVEEVIEKLLPPSTIQHLVVEEYFGRQQPNWMMVPATLAFKSLRLLRLQNLPYCTQLPHGLCWLPCLEALNIVDAPAIKSIGSKFQECSSLGVAFPNLTILLLAGLSAWEEWEWEGQGEDKSAEAMAMPALKVLTINNCKLRCLPPGLSSSTRLGLRVLQLYELSNLTSVENFPSVVELDVFGCPKLTRISGLSKLQKIRIFRSPIVEMLEGVSSLNSMEMEDAAMETLPEYLTTVTPRYLKLTCSKKLYESLLTGSSSENDKISHIKSRTIDYIAWPAQK